MNTWLPLVTKEDGEGEGGVQPWRSFAPPKCRHPEVRPTSSALAPAASSAPPPGTSGVSARLIIGAAAARGRAVAGGGSVAGACQPSPLPAVTITPSASRQPSRGARSGRWWGDFLSARDRPDFFSLPTWCLQELLRKLGWLGDLHSGTPARAMQAPPVAPEALLGSGSGPSSLGCSHSSRGHRSL